MGLNKNQNSGNFNGEVGDMSNYATKSDLLTKVTKEPNKSLVDNTLIDKLEDLENYDDSLMREEINSINSQLAQKTNKSETEALKTSLEEYVDNAINTMDIVSIVDSVEDMTDTDKQYVHSDTKTWWVYLDTTVPPGSIIPYVDNAIKWDTTEISLNKRLNSSYTEVDAPGCAIFYFTFNDEMKNILNTIDPVWIRMKGCTLYRTTNHNQSTKVNIWDSDGNKCLSASPSSQILVYIESEEGISDTPYSSVTFPYDDNKTAPVTAMKFGYCNTTISDNSTNERNDAYLSAIDGKLALSLIVNFASATAITEADLENVYITFNEPIVSYEELTVSDWCDTGIEYSPGDNGTMLELINDTIDLKQRVNSLEEIITYEEEEELNLPNYWLTYLNDLDDKLKELQMANGMDAFQFLWCSDIHGVPGTSPSNTTYIGEIGRHMMDKYNIPFFVASGDIMSQASHANPTSIWAEYDKLNVMLAPIKNEEFLAIKGNHDGVWGASMEYNGQANQYYHSYIGDKALFNAFMRRQTTDSHRRVFGKDGMYFYVDYHKYRIYMLNTHTFGDNSVNAQGQAVYNGFKHFVFGSEQLQWIADTLTTVKDNQEVIFVAHTPLQVVVDYTVFDTMIEHYVARTSGTASRDIIGTYWGIDTQYAETEITFNFTDAKGSIVGWFNGHNHMDAINTDLFPEMPIIYITTAGGDLRDSYLTNGTLTRVKGTPTETAMDLVTVTSDYIYLTRIGSGYDRIFNRTTNEVTIDYDSAYKPED